jgi:GrpB-like predicted nucleotidyltransferase (UPF0157 family)
VNYVFKPYDESFPKIFEEEKRRLEKYLTSHYQLEHFGSTSIPGLGGKGIIDIFLVVSEEDLPKILNEVERAGYDFRPSSGTDERFVCVREITNTAGSKERFHLHITHSNNRDYKKDIAFRDYLRTHPEDMNKYAKTKKSAAEKANQSKEEYMRLKEPIIQEILKKALSINSSGKS